MFVLNIEIYSFIVHSTKLQDIPTIIKYLTSLINTCSINLINLIDII